MPRKPGFGTVEMMRSGRYRARYYGPDGKRYKAPTAFDTKVGARDWLVVRRSEIIRQTWQSPDTPPAQSVTLTEYAEDWFAHRDLKARTRDHYRKLLDVLILPGLGTKPLTSITNSGVRRWRSNLKLDTPTMNAHAYGLLRTILGTAVSDGEIATNPCAIRGAGSAKRVHKIRPATVAELGTIVEKMPERYQAMILLASWCALRFGELTELRRFDLDLSPAIPVIRVERGVVRAGDKFTVTTPKSEAGIRDVTVPPHLLPALDHHLKHHTEGRKDALLFPACSGGHLQPSTFYRHYYRARDAAGRPDLRFHDLRHSGAVLAAATGATLAELMERLGHSTPQAAMRYQHAARGRGREIAALLSKIAENGGS